MRLDLFTLTRPYSTKQMKKEKGRKENDTGKGQWNKRVKPKPFD